MSEPVYPLHGPTEEERLKKDKEERAQKSPQPATPAPPPAEPEKE